MAQRKHLRCAIIQNLTVPMKLTLFTKKITVSSAFVVASSVAASANCFSPIIESRLRTFCIAEALSDEILSNRNILFLDALLKHEGYAKGLGFPTQVQKTSKQTFIFPLLEYNTDINGGNPDRTLVLGGIPFIGDPALVRKEGAVAGIGAGVNGRHIYGEGRYLDFNAGASYKHSPDYGIGIAQAFAGLCSRNHISNHWYIDGCANTNRTVKDLTQETKSNLSLSTSKLFSTSSTTHHAATIGIQRYFEHDAYQQNQLQLGWQIVQSKGIYGAVNVVLGEPVDDKLATRRSVSATLGTTVNNKPLTANVSYSYADGANLFGVERSDKTVVATINYAVHPRFSITVGYKKTDSTIDYFNDEQPIVGVQMTPIRF